MSRETLLMAGRVPVLLAVLWASHRPAMDLGGAITRLDRSLLWSSWWAQLAIGLVFVTVLLAVRRPRHPWPLLGAEAAIAGALAAVPPWYWHEWLYRGPLFVSGTAWLVEPLALVATATLTQPLATAWLGVVVTRAVWQYRDTPSASPERPRADAPDPPRVEGD